MAYTFYGIVHKETNKFLTCYPAESEIEEHPFVNYHRVGIYVHHPIFFTKFKEKAIDILNSGNGKGRHPYKAEDLYLLEIIVTDEEVNPAYLCNGNYHACKEVLNISGDLANKIYLRFDTALKGRRFVFNYDLVITGGDAYYELQNYYVQKKCD